MGERAFVAAGEADQAAVRIFQFCCFDGAFAFCGAEFHSRNQAAKIFVALGGSDQQRIAPAVHASDFRADMRANADFLRGQIKSWCAIEAIAIEQRHGRHAERGAGARQFFGRRSTFEKTESGAGMQFDIHQSYDSHAQTIFPAARHRKNGRSRAVPEQFTGKNNFQIPGVFLPGFVLPTNCPEVRQGPEA